MFRREPLNSTYMLVSMMGFIISALMLEILPSWAFAFMVVFIVMFIASVASLSNLSIHDKDAFEELMIHHHDHYAKKRKK
jgi:uncharacterized membrane protein